MKLKVGVAVLCLILGLIGYVLYVSIETYEETVNQGWSAKAKRNPFLALQQYLQLRGNTVQSSARMAQLDQLPDSGVILITDTRQLKKADRLSALRQWMEQGGNLVVGAHISSGDEKNALLEQFSVSKEQVDCDCEEQTENEDLLDKKLSELLRDANKKAKTDPDQTAKDTIPENKIDNSIPDSELTKLFFNNIDQPLRIHFDRGSALKHPTLSGEKHNGPTPFYWDGNSAGAQIMQFEVGTGLLTVLADAEIWNIEQIKKVDHAYLATILLGDKGNVLLVYGMQMPTLFELLQQHTPELLLACLVWLFIWLLIKTKRFGPVRELDVTTRRSLDEHISATSGYFWRSKHRLKLIEDMHAIVFRKIHRANPRFSALDETRQKDWLREQCDISSADVEMALYRTDIDSEDEFYYVISLIQKIGNRL